MARYAQHQATKIGLIREIMVRTSKLFPERGFNHHGFQLSVAHADEYFCAGGGIFRFEVSHANSCFQNR